MAAKTKSFVEIRSVDQVRTVQRGSESFEVPKTYTKPDTILTKVERDSGVVGYPEWILTAPHYASLAASGKIKTRQRDAVEPEGKNV